MCIRLGMMGVCELRWMGVGRGSGDVEREGSRGVVTFEGEEWTEGASCEGWGVRDSILPVSAMYRRWDDHAGTTCADTSLTTASMRIQSASSVRWLDVDYGRDHLLVTNHTPSRHLCNISTRNILSPMTGLMHALWYDDCQCRSDQNSHAHD